AFEGRLAFGPGVFVLVVCVCAACLCAVPWFVGGVPLPRSLPASAGAALSASTPTMGAMVLRAVIVLPYRWTSNTPLTRGAPPGWQASERRRPESNRCTRLCRPLRSHSATAPGGRRRVQAVDAGSDRRSL